MKKFFNNIPPIHPDLIAPLLAGVVVTGFISLIMLIAINPSSGQKYSPQNFLDAVQRMHPRADKICADGENTNAYLIHYADGVDENWFGWYWIKGIEFSDYGNKKISATEVTDTDRYHKVFPDVTGLTCLEKL